MATYLLKRKFYNNQTNMENAGDVAGRNVGGMMGTMGGMAVGGATAGAIGMGIGARAGWNKAASNNQLWNNMNTTADKAKSLTNSLGLHGNTMSEAGRQQMGKNIAEAHNAADAARKAAEKANVTGKMSKGGTALRKAGKYGALAALGGMAVGGILGNQAGKDAGSAAGVAAGGMVGSGVDRIVGK